MGRFAYDNIAGAFEHLDSGGRVVWRSDAAPAALLPPSSWLSYSGNVVFPEFFHGNAIYYGWNGGVGGGAVYQGVSFATVHPGTWGPDQASPYNIPRVTIGTVPKDCNYIDVVANLTQTQGTYSFFFSLVSIYQKQGQSTYLDGGCAVLEGTHAWRKIIKVVLAPTDNGDGTRNVYLEAYQSVKYQAQFTNDIGGNMKTGVQSYDGSATAAWQNLWTHDGDPTGWLSFPLAGSGNDIHSMRGGSGQPSTSDPTTYTSTWAVTLSVRPGFAHP